MERQVLLQEEKATKAMAKAISSPGTYASTFAEAEKDLHKLEQKLVAVGTTNHYQVDTLAHLHSVLAKVLDDEKWQQKLHRMQLDGRHKPVSTQLSERGDRIFEVIDANEAASERQQKEQKEERNDDRDYVSEHVNEAIRVYVKLNSLRRSVRKSWLIMLLENAIQALSDVDGIDGVNDWLARQSIDSRYNFFYHGYGRVYEKLMDDHGAGSHAESFLVRKRGVVDPESSTTTLFYSLLAIRGPETISGPEGPENIL
jgi:hypothetical protein